MGFALLSRLRYLNLKNNNFTIFPEVVRSPAFSRRLAYQYRRRPFATAHGYASSGYSRHQP